jgi:hypothetical protein
MPELAAWENFYIIVGSSGAALTGLMFVVVTLISDLEESQASSGTLGAFGTPTIVHFCAALIVSAVLSAPWRAATSVAVAVGVCGVVGLAYALNVIKRARRQSIYRPVFEDWLWHTVLPVGAYATIAIAALVFRRAPEPSLFAIGGAVLGLVLIGIHNAWDTLTYLAVARREDRNQPKT